MEWGITCFFQNQEDFSIVKEIAPQYPIRYIEIRGEQPFFSPQDITEENLSFFQNVIKETGLQVTLHSTFYDINLATLNEYLRKATMECYRKYIDLGHTVGAEIMVLHAGHIHRDITSIPELKRTARNNLLENITALANYAQDKGVKIGLENSPPNKNPLMVSDWENHIKILDELSHSNVGAVLDFAHAFLHNLDLSQYLDNIYDYLIEIHIHNNDGKQDFHAAVNQGVIDYESIFRGRQLDVPVIMEIRNFQEAMQSLEWVKQFEKRR